MVTNTETGHDYSPEERRIVGEEMARCQPAMSRIGAMVRGSLEAADGELILAKPEAEARWPALRFLVQPLLDSQMPGQVTAPVNDWIIWFFEPGEPEERTGYTVDLTILARMLGVEDKHRVTFCCDKQLHYLSSGETVTLFEFVDPATGMTMLLVFSAGPPKHEDIIDSKGQSCGLPGK